MLIFLIFYTFLKNITKNEFKNIDPYFTLGLKKYATEREIERAYKRFSEFREKQLNPSEKLRKQMDEIQYAYNLIKDNSTRAIYDKFGPKIFNIDNFSVYDYYSEEEVTIARSSIPEKSNQMRKNGGVIVFPVMFSLKDFMRGRTKSINILRSVPCVCSQRTKQCRKCRVSPVMTQYQNYQLVLPKGSHPLQRVYALNITDTDKERCATDVIFVAHQKPNKRFLRIGNDIYSNITVNLSDTFRVQDYRFKNADDRIVTFSLDHVKDGDVIKIKGKGVPYNAKGDICGDLILTVRVIFPTQLNDDQREKIRKTLSDDVNDYE